jgi:fibronectin type 3 domain-containing protein
VLPPSGAPVITVEVDSTSEITVSWPGIPGASYYTLQYSTSIDFSSPVTIDNINNTNHTVTWLLQNTQYHFRVYAINDGGDGPVSNVASATTHMTPPGAPSISVATNSASQITVSWSSVLAASAYILQYSTSSSFSSPTTINSITTTSRAVTGLSAGTTYYFRVYAVNAGGNSAASNSASAITRSAAPSISATANSTSQITASWGAVTGAASYTLQYSTSSGFSGAQQITGITTTSRAVTGLSAGTTYYFRVYAVNAGGNSAASNSASAATQVNPPSAPSISVSTSSSTQIAVSWSSVSGATSYRLQYSTSSSFSSPTTINSLTGTSTTVSSLAQATTYYFRLYAINAGGTSGASNSAEATTQVDTPGTPTASASYHGPRAYSSGTWARDYNGNPSSGTFYALVANLSGSSCPSGSTRQFRARVQYNSPKTWGSWTSWVTSTAIYTPQASSPYGVRYEIQARCYVSSGNISGTSASRYVCYWSGSGSTSCSGF